MLYYPMKMPAEKTPPHNFDLGPGGEGVLTRKKYTPDRTAPWNH